MNRKRDGYKTAKDSTISGNTVEKFHSATHHLPSGNPFLFTAFISEQVKSRCPVCRRYAYQILGLIATRCFDVLGEKVVGHLLLKKRLQEVPENRLTITVILWNLLFIWPEYLTHVLLFPDFVTPKYGESAVVGSDSLLINLWDDGNSVPQRNDTQSCPSSAKSIVMTSERAISILSIARIIVAKRLASQHMTKLVVCKN